jgi:hypothetical protein
MTTRWAARIALVGALAGCRIFEEPQGDDTCTTCTDDDSPPTDPESTTPVDTADYFDTPAGEYAYDPDCIIGYDPIPTVYYVHTYTIDGTDVAGTDEMVWVSHPSTGIPVCSFSWPVTGTAAPCDEDCDLHLAVHTGEGTNHGCSEDRASWGDLFASSDSEWFVWTDDEVRAAFALLDDGYPATFADGVLTFQHTQCNGL